jgi:hypothetical protein
MRAGDAKTMFQVIVGPRQVWEVITRKQTRREVLGDLHKVIDSRSESAQARLLFLHVCDEGHIGFSDLRTRLLLVVGQNVSGLIHQRIGVLEGRPERCGALQGAGENILEVL